MRSIIVLGAMLALSGAMHADDHFESHLTHTVFFDLNDDDPAAVQALVDGCYKYLAPHDGIVYFSAGARQAAYQRDVNDLDFDVASNPEFLREGAAIDDFMRPDRVVVGVESDRAQSVMEEIYQPLFLRDFPIVTTDLESAEMIKYAANAVLAT